MRISAEKENEWPTCNLRFCCFLAEVFAYPGTLPEWLAHHFRVLNWTTSKLENLFCVSLCFNLLFRGLIRFEGDIVSNAINNAIWNTIYMVTAEKKTRDVTSFKSPDFHSTLPHAILRLQPSIFTYLRRNSGISFKAAHTMNTKPLNLRSRVPSYTLLNSMTPKNWEKTFRKP